jgi:hypothetical protein
MNLLEGSRMQNYRELSVGPAGADIVGTNGHAIQMAVDTLAARGGGTVRVLPGRYELIDAVRLRSGVSLLGDRDRTILYRAPVVVSPAKVDPDGGQWEATPEDVSGFRVGMGITIRDSVLAGNMALTPLRVERIENGRLFFNERLEYQYDFKTERGAIIANHYPMMMGLGVRDVVVDGFTLDGRVSSTAALENLWSAGFYLRFAEHCTVRNVVSENMLGDGIQFCTSEHCTAEDCETRNNTHYGLHPGGHSPWSILRRCHVHGNGSDGIYVCWGVREGVIEGCRIHHNGRRLHRNGISIGHKDTDFLMVGNHVYENAKHGICFRVEKESNAANRTTVRDNTIENNGSPEKDIPAALRAEPRYEVLCSGVFIRGDVHDLLFERNIVRETRTGAAALQHDGFYLDRGVSRVRLVGNQISGHPGQAVVDDSGSRDNDLRG